VDIIHRLPLPQALGQDKALDQDDHRSVQLFQPKDMVIVCYKPLSEEVGWINVFGKHCECIAQECTHLGRLPPLASHLLLMSHCVLTLHGAQKKKSYTYVRLRDSNKGRLGLQLMCRPTVLFDQSCPMGHTVQLKNVDLFKLQITTFAENGKIQLTPKITNNLFTCYLNCMCKSNPVCLIRQWSVIFLLTSYVQ